MIETDCSSAVAARLSGGSGGMLPGENFKI